MVGRGRGVEVEGVKGGDERSMEWRWEEGGGRVEEVEVETDNQLKEKNSLKENITTKEITKVNRNIDMRVTRDKYIIHSTENPEQAEAEDW